VIVAAQPGRGRGAAANALRDSYLNIPRINIAARIPGPTRFNPARLPRENAEFADIVRTSNISRGPSGDQIRQMGDRPAARKAGAEATRCRRCRALRAVEDAERA